MYSPTEAKRDFSYMMDFFVYSEDEKRTRDHIIDTVVCIAFDYIDVYKRQFVMRNAELLTLFEFLNTKYASF